MVQTYAYLKIEEHNCEVGLFHLKVLTPFVAHLKRILALFEIFLWQLNILEFQLADPWALV